MTTVVVAHHRLRPVRMFKAEIGYRDGCGTTDLGQPTRQAGATPALPGPISDEDYDLLSRVADAYQDVADRVEQRLRDPAMTSPARSHAAGLGIQTVPITNCAVTLRDADDSTLDAFTMIRDRSAAARA